MALDEPVFTVMMRILGLCLVLLSLPSAAFSAAPVEANYFGLHIHRADQGTAWPSVPFGSWRLWDAAVSWDRIEPASNQWDFGRLDRYVAMAGLTRVEPVMVLANTPRWAAARPDEPSGYKPGNASEPADMAVWERFVRKVAERYKGRIRHYEIWNEPDDKNHFTGTLATMVEMTCRAYRQIKAADPEARVISPATAGAGGHIEYLERFLAAGGKACVDVIAHHFYVPRLGPEAMVPLIREVKSVMRRQGVAAMPLWNTETGWWIENQDGRSYGAHVTRGGWRLLSAQEAADTVIKALLLARGEGVERFYWYAWDNGSLGFVEPGSQVLKPAANAWSAAVRLLLGATVEPCVQTTSEWQCSITSREGVRRVSWPLNATATVPREGGGAYPQSSQIRGLP